MRTKTIKATIGIHSGYDKNNGVDDVTEFDFGTMYLDPCCKEVEKITGIYPSFVFSKAYVNYNPKNGCPKGGEFIYVIESTVNCVFGRLAPAEEAIYMAINLLKEMLNQETVSIMSYETELTYLHNQQLDNFPGYSLRPDSEIYWAKVKENAIIPTKRLEDAGYDLYACFEEDYMIIEPHTTKIVPSGIAVSVPVGFELQIEERGSTGSKGIKYSAGVIDSGYRGEICLCVTNTNTKPIIIIKKEILEKIETNSYTDLYSKDLQDKIVYPYEKAIFQGVVLNINNQLKSSEIPYEVLCNIESERGTGKLGSSNK